MQRIGKKNAEIQVNVHGTVVKDEKQVAEVLVDYFATIADGIGGNTAPALTRLLAATVSRQKS